MLHRQVIGGLVSVILSTSSAFGQSASIPDTSILSTPYNKTQELLNRLRLNQERANKDFFRKFMACNGLNGNADMSMEYGDPDYYFIDKEGKCTYQSLGGQ